MNTLQLKQLRPTATVPIKGSYDAACWDIYAAEGAWLSAGAAVRVPTGWAMQIPKGHCVKIYARSGLASEHGITLANGVGVIDADYRGEVLVALVNTSNASYQIKVGERIAQFMLERVEPTALMVVSELDDTARGVNGFGSTG